MRKRTSTARRLGGDHAAASAAGEPSGAKKRSARREVARKTRGKHATGPVAWRLALAAGAAAILVAVAVFVGGLNAGYAAMTGPVLSEDAKIADFQDWFRAAGGNVSSSIGVAAFPGMGKGIVALEDVEESDTLLFVPRSIIICRDTIAAEWSTQPKLLKKLALLEKDQEELLTAFLVLEQLKGDTSRWNSYLQLLPPISLRGTSASPLLFTSDADVDALQDERIVTISRAERAHAEQAYRRFQRLFRSHLSPIPSGQAVDLPFYTWARFLVNSRAFSIRGQRVLVPFGDIFNGEPHHEKRANDNGQRFLQFHELQAQGMTIRADRSTSAGHQVLEDYGDNSNYVYFLYHGFLMRDGGFDCAAFRLPPLREAYVGQVPNSDEPREALEAKKGILARIRVEDAPLSCISREGKVEDPELLRIYLMLYNMNAQTAVACSQATSFEQCFGSLSLTSDAKDQAAFVHRGVRQQLEKYPTTLEDDEQILHELESSEGSEQSSSRHAVVFRLSRKRLLRVALSVLSEQQKDGDPGTTEILGSELEPARGDKLERFQRWLARQHFPVNHLELRYINAAVGYGTFAAKPLTSGEVYLSVPTSVVMSVQSAMQSSWVRGRVRELEGNQLVSPTDASREDPALLALLLHLLEEKFGSRKSQSRWKPYLDMLPTLDETESGSNLGSPLFYEEEGEQMRLLADTDLYQLVVNYRRRVDASYSLLSRQLERSGIQDALTWLTKKRFLWANAMLDSRSIWWEGQRHLVPLLDMVNCQELAPTHAPHHTLLDAPGHNALTRASWNFAQGQEVVENYAQPNHIYLLYHGFVLAVNTHDCAHVRLKLRSSAQYQRELLVVLQELRIFSWTPDVCVDPRDREGVTRFVKLVLIAENPDAAAKLLAASPGAATSAQAVTAALDVIETRLAPLNGAQIEDGDADDKDDDFRTHTVALYRQQQRQLLLQLQDALKTLAS